MEKRELIWGKTLSRDSNRNNGSDSWTCSLQVLWDSTAHFSKAQILWPKAKICWVAFNCNMPLYMHTQADADHHQGVKRRAENIYEGEKKSSKSSLMLNYVGVDESWTNAVWGLKASRSKLQWPGSPGWKQLCCRHWIPKDPWLHFWHTRKQLPFYTDLEPVFRMLTLTSAITKQATKYITPAKGNFFHPPKWFTPQMRASWCECVLTFLQPRTPSVRSCLPNKEEQKCVRTEEVSTDGAAAPLSQSDILLEILHI